MSVADDVAEEAIARLAARMSTQRDRGGWTMASLLAAGITGDEYNRFSEAAARAVADVR